MKNLLKSFLFLLLFFTFSLCLKAKSNYSDAVDDARDFMTTSSYVDTYSKFIQTINDTNKFYSINDNIVDNEDFKYGGLLGKWEFDITRKGKSNNYSYLYNSNDYWTYTNKNNKKYVVSSSSKFVDHKDNNNIFDTRVTEFPYSHVSVTGSGSYLDPWIFEPQYSVTIKVNDSSRGKLGFSKDDINKDIISFTMSSSSDKSIYIKPLSGNEYLGTTCGVIANDFNIRNNTNGSYNTMIIHKVTRDIECVINFGEKVYKVNLFEYQNASSAIPSVLYIIKEKSWYADYNKVDAIVKLEKSPELYGYNYKGYYTKKNISNDKFKSSCDGFMIIDEENRLASTSLKKDGTITSNDKESMYYDDMTIYPCFTPKEYRVDYVCHDGSGSVASTNHIFNEKSKLASGSGCSREGYTFVGWSSEPGGKGNKYKENQDVSELTNDESITLYADWKANTYTITYYLGNAASTNGVSNLGTSKCTFDGECTLSSFSTFDKPFPYSKEAREESEEQVANYGWEFYGWTTDMNVATVNSNDDIKNSAKYSNGDKFIYDVASNLNLYAIGVRTMHINGGVSPTSSIDREQYWNPYSTSSDYLSDVSLPDGISIPGWTFTGYICGRSNDPSAVSFSADVAGTDYRIPYNKYAYTRSVYSRNLKIVYDGRGGSGSSNEQTMPQYYNSGYALNGENKDSSIFSVKFTLLTGYKKRGYKFDKWVDSDNENNKYDEGSEFEFCPDVLAKNTTKEMYATWVESPTSLPDFKYTGGYELVTDDDKLIASGEGGKTPDDDVIIIPSNYEFYDGNWKLRLLSGGDLIINDMPNADAVDLYLVGGGQGGNKGSWEGHTTYTVYGAGAGGAGGYRKKYENVNIEFGVLYSVAVGAGGSSSGNNGGDSSITIDDKVYISSEGVRSSSNKDGGVEFDESIYSRYYGGGGGYGCSCYSTGCHSCNGGPGRKGGGGQTGTAGWTGGYTCNGSLATKGSDGAKNTGGGGGGGGGGCGKDIKPGGKGGSGIVILRNAR